MSDNLADRVAFTGELLGYKVFEGSFDRLAVMDLLHSLASLRLAELRKEDRITENMHEEEMEEEEIYEALLPVYKAIAYMEENLNDFFRDCLCMMLREASLSNIFIFDEGRGVQIDHSIGKIVNQYKRGIKRRWRLYGSNKGPISEKKAQYTQNYPRHLEAWQKAEKIYRNWLAEAKRLNRGILNEEDLKGAEWKRRIRTKLANIADMPDDLLNRFVREDRSPLFIPDLDDYSRTPSRIAAIHTARHCNLPDNLSYETYMKIRREGARLLGVKKDSPDKDTHLVE